MLLKLALALINLCINDQRNLIHSLKNNLPQQKVACFFIWEKLMNKTFSGGKEVKLKFSEFTYTRVSVIVCTEDGDFHTSNSTEGETELQHYKKYSSLLRGKMCHVAVVWLLMERGTT